MNNTMRTRPVVWGAFIFLAIVIGIASVAWLRPATAQRNDAASQIEDLSNRLDALEEKNRAMAAALAHRGKFSSNRPSSATQLLMAHKQVEHQQRMQDDPTYAARLDRKRLAALDQEFISEPVSIRWASETSVRVEDALASAAKDSGFGQLPGSVDCRSTRCRIRFTTSSDASYEDLITYLTMGIGDLLPSTKLVVIPEGNGTQSIHVFALPAAKRSPHSGG